MKGETIQKKIYNLDRSDKVKLVIFLLGMILFGTILIKFFGSNEECEIKEYTLINQSLEFSSDCKTIKCLFLTLQDKNGTVIISYFDSDTKLVNESFGINNGDKLKMKWCEIPNIGKRVRGISKIS